VGTRKALTLARAGANVTVVAPKITDELAREVEAGLVAWRKEHFKAEHLTGACLVVMATDDEVMNAAGTLLAGQERSLACDASSASHSQVIFGALLEREGVTIATFTDGQDPARAREMRDRLARLLAADEAAPGTGPATGSGSPSG